MKAISLVLSGGGARGIAHIGVIEEFENQGFKIQSIAGTSMGSLIGGIYAAGTLKEFKKWATQLDKVDIFKLIDFTLLNNGFVKGDKVFKELKNFIPDINIQDLKIHYAAVATDIIKRKEIVFTEGSLIKAIRASVSIPSVFTPVMKEDSIIVDGGVVNNIPINHVQRTKDDILVAVNVNANTPLPKIKKKEIPTKTVEKQAIYQGLVKSFNDTLHKILPNEKKSTFGRFDIMNHSYEMMRDQLVKLYLEINPPDILIETSREFCGIYDFYKAKDLIDYGREVTAKSIKKYQAELKKQ